VIEATKTPSAASAENVRPMVSGEAPCVRPILFSGPMIRAILDGRKTQTRRVARLISSGRVARAGRNWHPDDPNAVLACPFGQPGDRLWVRETWCMAGPAGTYDEAPADGRPCWPDALPVEQRCFYRATEPGVDGGWVPSIHMPRWASRISLEVIGSRIERLQQISDADSMAEGVAVGKMSMGHIFTARELFTGLWESINGPESWKANPLVWVISFRVV